MNRLGKSCDNNIETSYLINDKITEVSDYIYLNDKVCKKVQCLAFLCLVMVLFFVLASDNDALLWGRD